MNWHTTSMALTYKSPNVVVRKEADNLKIYFDERLSRQQAMNMLTSSEDGKFIDFETNEVSVELIAYNAVRNILSYCKVTFSWDVGGKIPWNIGMEVTDKLHHRRKFSVVAYAKNMIDVYLLFN
mmetsp:Transcript_45673/g.143366  ORF Transcript_45673/g.143366 Transcript_45673/m.143366 type:complete len:124 (-) Transcript_45673:27-398(-)